MNVVNDPAKIESIRHSIADGPVKSTTVGGVPVALPLSRSGVMPLVAGWPRDQILAAYRVLTTDHRSNVLRGAALAVVQGAAQLAWWEAYVGEPLPTYLLHNQQARIIEARASHEEEQHMATETKKVAKVKKAPGEKKPRAAMSPRGMAPGAKITVVADKNPKREGTRAHKLFALFAASPTVAAYVEHVVKAGLPRGSALSEIRYCQKRGFIKIGAAV